MKDRTYILIKADARHIPLADNSVHCVCTSPPYWGLRDYKCEGQLGLEKMHDCTGWATGQPCGECYVCHIVEVFREVRRVLRHDGTCFLNIGDSYAGAGDRPQNNGKGNEHSQQKRHKTPDSSIGLKPKDLCMIPARLALALQSDGWWLRSDIIWDKKNPMPESVQDRCTSAHEHIFMLTKSASYFYDNEAVREPAINTKMPGHNMTDTRLTYGAQNGGNSGLRDLKALYHNGEAPTSRNLRDVWTLATEPFKDAHFAVFPSEIPRRAVRAGTSERGVCSACGAPWKRVVEKNGGNWQERKESGAPMRYGMNNNKGEAITHYGGSCSSTVGWQASCKCDSDTAPATVLDPFCGSGTTGKVALDLGRNFVGLDLKDEYLAMSRKRLDAASQQAKVLFW